MVNLIVFGGRDFTDRGMFDEAMYGFPNILTSEFVNGMCDTGADLMAREYARMRGRKVHEFPADWDTYGKAAGPRRNAAMAKFGSVGIGFWDGKSSGTKNMIMHALQNGCELHVYRYKSGSQEPPTTQQRIGL